MAWFASTKASFLKLIGRKRVDPCLRERRDEVNQQSPTTDNVVEVNDEVDISRTRAQVVFNYLKIRWRNILKIFMMFAYGIILTAAAYSSDFNVYAKTTPIVMTILAICCGIYFHEEKRSNWFKGVPPAPLELCCFYLNYEILFVVTVFMFIDVISMAVGTRATLAGKNAFFDHLMQKILEFFHFCLIGGIIRCSYIKWKKRIRIQSFPPYQFLWYLGYQEYKRISFRIVLLISWYKLFDYFPLSRKDFISPLLYIGVIAFLVNSCFVWFSSNHCHRDDCCKKIEPRIPFVDQPSFSPTERTSQHLPQPDAQSGPSTSTVESAAQRRVTTGQQQRQKEELVQKS